MTHHARLAHMSRLTPPMRRAPGSCPQDGHIIEVEIENASKEIIAELRKLSWVQSAEHSGRFINIRVKDKNSVFYKLSNFFQKKRQRVLEIRFKELSLEDVFIHLTKKDLRD